MKLSIQLDAIFSFNFHDKGSLYTISWEELEAFFIVLLYPWKTHNNFCYILQHLTFELMNRKTVIIEKLSSYYVVARTKTRSSLLWKSSFFHLSLSVSLALVLSTSRRIIPLSSRPSFHRSSPARINDAADRKVLRATPCEWELRKKSQGRLNERLVDLFMANWKRKLRGLRSHVLSLSLLPFSSSLSSSCYPWFVSWRGGRGSSSGVVALFGAVEWRDEVRTDLPWKQDLSFYMIAPCAGDSPRSLSRSRAEARGWHEEFKSWCDKLVLWKYFVIYIDISRFTI